MYVCDCYYLYKEDNEKIEVGYPPELLEQILWDKIPNCVLKPKKKKTTKHFRQRLKKGYLGRVSAGFKKPYLRNPQNARWNCIKVKYIHIHTRIYIYTLYTYTKIQDR